MTAIGDVCAVPAVAAPLTVPITDAETGIRHLMTDEVAAAGRRLGRYQALCGAVGLPASLTTADREHCRRCAEHGGRPIALVHGPLRPLLLAIRRVVQRRVARLEGGGQGCWFDRGQTVPSWMESLLDGLLRDQLIALGDSDLGTHGLRRAELTREGWAMLADIATEPHTAGDTQ